MTTKLLSKPALNTIEQYLHFKVDHAIPDGRQAECSVPYFNNKRTMQRAGFRATIGKGSPKEILDEVEIQGLREKIKPEMWTNDFLKKFMCDNNIGIDCSGLAYHILASENNTRGVSSLDRHLTFPNNKGLRRFIAKFRPVENADVLTFAHEKNSGTIGLKDIQPGDFITMTGAESERNHIMIIHQVDYQNFVPTTIHYTHSIALPDDGQYGHGVRQGSIEILDPTKNLLEQKWIEKGKTGQENPIYLRAKISKMEVRRLRWWE